MKLLVVRHAIAEPRTAFARTGQHDDRRPTTPEGRRRMRRISQGLKVLVPEVHLLVSSPLVRACQTLDILAREYPGAATGTRDELAPDHELPAFLRWLRGQPRSGVVAIVGHEPHLSHLASWLLAGRFTSFLELKKGGACLLHFSGEPAPAEARMHWLLQPAQLRRVARTR